MSFTTHTGSDTKMEDAGTGLKIIHFNIAIIIFEKKTHFLKTFRFESYNLFKTYINERVIEISLMFTNLNTYII